MNDPLSAEPDLIKDLLTKPIPKNLWHYTSYKAFQGIVESKQIFATDLRYLNDSQEFVHAKELAQELADEVVDSSAAGVVVNGMLKKAVDLAFNTGPLRADRLQVMVASFSNARDQLSQWRGYSGASSGVSISFDLSKIRPPLGVETAVVFAPCVYELSEKKALLQRALSHMVGVVAEWVQDVQEAIQSDPQLLNKIKNPTEHGSPYVNGLDLNARLRQAMTKVNFDLVRLCPLLKDSSFSEEREWRLVLPISAGKQLQNPIKFRPTSNTLVPYIPYPLCGPDEPAPVNDLILGPGSHAEAEAATFSFLQSKHIMVKPQTSKVPYRAS
ncbi:DUF2971 domain-containing protein [Terriglobus albidus]|uniref:DUF2971 domain-containing protein n=1 Tax=Terriglobus albidus TaxID=1592106 RepID=A0A5B9E8P6_9BACT|nr:DUF2971 domain-containing protein [Terriglobus albidus]QEE28573.1 DUF2971 domain-containing protein [Terriglobus albidus]